MQVMAQAAMKMFMATAVLLAASLWFPAAGQSGCTTALISLAPCLNYISGNSTNPSSTCCSQLAGVVQSEPQCLCTVLNGGASSLGISINQTQALALPSACKVQTPPASQCKSGAGGSAASPTQSPKTTPSTPATPSDSAPPTASPETPSSSSSPAAEGSPSGTGSKSTNGSPSNDSTGRSDVSIVFSVLIFAASCISALL